MVFVAFVTNKAPLTKFQKDNNDVYKYYVEFLRILYFAYRTIFMFMNTWKPNFFNRPACLRTVFMCKYGLYLNFSVRKLD
jgi:hypothetical protein